ncbi:hypothetical protein [Pedobacter cryoconitis]|uniref:Uncharacterized protein n=1 Tax=Pedobacter cryoconitis TaxID=188932 RepID=A0A7X0MI98_9SPHI|nr:hypothetical protein [Pedobacter cryoconitis]MBB6498305.1 hypothetical protein [Pedobacter cryoconitis]
MKVVFKPFLIVFLMSCAVTNVSAQLNPGTGNAITLGKYQDSLLKITRTLFTAPNNIDRFEQNARFIKTLVTALKTPSSFEFEFDSLQTISVVRSPDNAFRIFSWYVPTVEGTYRFFGTIQMATRDGKLKLYPLIDDTEHFKDLNQISTNKQWYGARYYEVVPLIVGGQNTSYVLLGWKGNTAKTSKKVIDVLSFVNDEPKFGKAIFQGPKNAPVKNRVVFEYNKLNSMTLRLDKKEQMIVFDHLAPFDPNMEGNFEYYASDSSFDGYRLVGDKLKLMENIELKNDPDAKDDLYIDPKPKVIPAKN